MYSFMKLQHSLFNCTLQAKGVILLFSLSFLAPAAAFFLLFFFFFSRLARTTGSVRLFYRSLQKCSLDFLSRLQEHNEQHSSDLSHGSPLFLQDASSDVSTVRTSAALTASIGAAVGAVVGAAVGAMVGSAVAGSLPPAMTSAPSALAKSLISAPAPPCPGMTSLKLTVWPE